MDNEKKKIIFYLSLIFTLFFLVSISSANAGSLYFSPSSGSYTVGGSFSVNVYISTPEQTMNAASGVISFPQDKLEVVSLSQSGSIITFWVQEPSFSNSTGRITFEGIVLNPGFKGASGKIITVNFRVKAAGLASLTFYSSSLLANDGQGTNILTSLGDAQFSLGGAAPTAPTLPEATTPSAVSGAPSAPQISSPTHLDSEKWYSNNNPEFSWKLPSDVNGVSIFLSESPTSSPGPVSDGLFGSKSYENIEDGIWYFHIKMRNSAGWGPVTHFKFQIDTQPPEQFLIKFLHNGERTDPNPIITFNTSDEFSGIDYYRVKIGESDFLKLEPDFIISNPYVLPPQEPGQRTVLVQAFDKAGNTTSAVEEFEILPIKAATITFYPKEVKQGDLLEIRGTTYPDASVDIFLKKESEEIIKQNTRSNSSGDFNLIWSPKLKNGLYEMWSQVTDSRGAKSYESPPLVIVVKSSAILQIGSFIISYLSIIFLLISIIFTLIVSGWYAWHRFTLFRKKLKKEVREAEEALHKAFDLLKEDIRKQIKILEKTRTKRQLTEEEDKIIKRLNKDLDDAEKFVKKEIKDIENIK